MFHYVIQISIWIAESIISLHSPYYYLPIRYLDTLLNNSTRISIEQMSWKIIIKI